MRKRLFALLATLTMLMSIAPSYLVHADASVKLGDYVQMGTYYGKPILWRCVSFEKITGYKDGTPIVDSTDTSTVYKDGYLPLMLSDRILCLKPFDAKGTVTGGSHGRGYYQNGTQGYSRQSSGSNYWADSNMRSWLNSYNDAGEVSWLCGNAPTITNVYNKYNAYDQEAGFLTNFTDNEQKLLNPVTQKTIIDGYEHSTGSANTVDANSYKAYLTITKVVSNYATAYSENVTDTVFLLDAQQINTVYNNSNVLGNMYYVAKPTEECISNSNYNLSTMSTDAYYTNWLRTPNAQFNGSNMLYVYSDGSIKENSAYDGRIGVRPAFYLNATTDLLNYGDGTSAHPYQNANIPSSTTVSKDGDKTTLNVSLPTEATGKQLVVALFQDSSLIEVTTATITGETMTVNTEKNYDKLKVMVWNDIGSMQPYGVVEEVD